MLFQFSQPGAPLKIKTKTLYVVHKASYGPVLLPSMCPPPLLLKPPLLLPLRWSILWVNLSEAQYAQIVGQIVFWVCL